MDEIKKITEQLLMPFPEKDIEWRVQRAGKKNDKTWAIVVPYVTNRAIMERLDSVFGINGWQNKFKPLEGGGCLCGILCKVDGEWITKWDGADNTDIVATKGGISSAMKRAGVQWGIGRYLYHLEAGFADVCENGKLKGQWKDKAKNTHYFKYNPPSLPDWALPEGIKPPSPSKNPPQKPQETRGDEFRVKMDKALSTLGESVFWATVGAKFGYDDIEAIPLDKREEVLAELRKEAK